MKKYLLLTSLLCLTLTLSGCKGSDGTDKVTLGQYKGIEVTTDTNPVTEDELEDAIQQVLSAKADTKEVTGRTVQTGDVVNIDYEGLKDGVAFEGGTAQGQDLEIGSGKFIEGFEEGLVGAKTGEKRSLNLTFPENYQSADLAGQKVVFNVTVNAIKEKILPELTDKLVQEISDKKTVEEYREYARETLNAQKANARKSEAWNIVMNNSTVSEYPQKDVDSAVKELNTVYAQQVSSYGMTLSDYLASNNITEEQFNTQLQTMAKQTVAQQLVVKAIASAEKLEITDAEYKTGVEKILADSGLETVADLEKQYGKDYLRLMLLQDKVLELVNSSAVTK